MKNSNTLFQDFCKYCGSFQLMECIEPRASIYHGRLICNDCKSFVKWIPKHQKLIDIILASGRVNGWENMFLRNIRTRKHLSPAQSRKFEQIMSKHQIKSPVPTVDTG